MNEEFEIAHKLYKEGKLAEARDWFMQVLAATGDETEERICERLLKEIDAKLKSLSAVSVLSIAAVDNGERLACSVILRASDRSLRELARNIYEKNHRRDYVPQSTVDFSIQGNGAILRLEGRECDARCTLCLKFRNQLKDNLGAEGFLEEGSCPRNKS